MGERSARLEDFVPGGTLELQIGPQRIAEPLVIEPEVEIDADPGLVELSDPGGDEGPAGHPAGRALGVESLLDVLAEREHPIPGHRRLERFTQDPVPHHEVTEIRDPEGELVAPPPVLGAGPHPAVLSHQYPDRAPLGVHLAAGSLVHQRARDHLGRPESPQPGHQEPFQGPPDGGAPAGPRLQGLAQLELEVVHQPDAGGDRPVAG